VTWLLKEAPNKTFRRNTLAIVVLQLRFHPILKVAERIADFQDRVRPRFPGFETVEIQNMEITSVGVQVRNEIAYRFIAAAEPTVVSLGTSAVSIEYSEHQSREVLLADLEMVLSALDAVYAHVLPKRLGVRYVNLIDKVQISSDLGRSVDWTDLLARNFAQTPGGIAELDEVTTFMVEVASPCTHGRMTVRYGIPGKGAPVSFGLEIFPSAERKFRLDTDRYIEGSFKFTEIRSLANEFTEDIFHLFMTAAGPALVEWMSQGEQS